MNRVLSTNKVSCFTQKHSAVKLLPTRLLMKVLPRLKFHKAITAFTPLLVFLIKTFTAKKVCLHETRSGFEPEMPVTCRKNCCLFLNAYEYYRIFSICNGVLWRLLFHCKDLLPHIAISDIFKLPFVAVRSNFFGTAKHPSLPSQLFVTALLIWQGTNLTCRFGDRNGKFSTEYLYFYFLISVIWQCGQYFAY